MKEMKHKIKKGILFIPIFIGGLFLFTWLVMLLWNAILPSVIPSVKAISYWQALGILVLSKILFGGFGGGKRWRGNPEWKEKMRRQWHRMTPEEKEKFKAEWKYRCGGKWDMPGTTDKPAATATE